MYDLIILGAGPAGLTASIYASCFHLNHLVIGKVLGGQMILAPDIINYPGFENISGTELTQKMVSQVEKRGGKIIIDSVSKINKIEEGFELSLEKGETHQAKAIILATGMERRKLNIKGEVEYTSKGVYYCATCEKFDYLDRIVAVVGGSNSALQAGIQLSHAAKKVFIIYRGTELRGDPIYLEKIKQDPKIEVKYNTQVTEIIGDGQKVTGLKLSTGDTLPLEQIYIEIGGVPGSALLVPLGVEVDQGGFIKVDEKLATNIPAIFAAGDIVNAGFSIEQVSTAVGLGAKAAVSAFSYLKHQTPPTLWGESQINR